MKIAIASDSYYPFYNGCSLFVQRLAAALVKRGHTVLVLATSAKITNTRFQHNGALVYGFRSLPSLVTSNFRVSPPIGIESRIEQILTSFKPDVVHINSNVTIGKATAGIAKRLGYPTLGTVLFIPENLLENVAFYLPLVKRVEHVVGSYMWKDYARTYNTFKKVTAPTKTAAELAKHYGLRKKIIPISSGLDLAHFKPGTQSNTLRKKYKIPKKAIILSVSRLDKEKHVDTILSAYARVAKKNNNVHLVVGGTGLQEDALQFQVAELGLGKRITFIGKIADRDLPGIYRLAKMLVVASTAELQCIVAMEAMATGLPVIAADALALPELIQHKKNGFLFEPENAGLLAVYIQELLENEPLRRRMGETSLQFIKDHKLSRTVDAYEALYNELVQKT